MAVVAAVGDGGATASTGRLHQVAPSYARDRIGLIPVSPRYDVGLPMYPRSASATGRTRPPADSFEDCNRVRPTASPEPFSVWMNSALPSRRAELDVRAPCLERFGVAAREISRYVFWLGSHTSMSYVFVRQAHVSVQRSIVRTQVQPLQYFLRFAVRDSSSRTSVGVAELTSSTLSTGAAGSPAHICPVGPASDLKHGV